MNELSAREAQTLEFIRSHISCHGRSPYQHEITDHFNWASRAFTWRMLNSMIRKGAIAAMPNVPGSITICETKIREPIAVALRNDVRDALDLISNAEGAEAATIIAEWVSERVAYELRSKARAA